jgi:hypothetical protein
VTVDLAHYTAEDVETLLVAWLTPLRRSGSFRDPDTDPLPFTLITGITGTENISEGFADPVVSVHTFCDKAAGEVAARDECTKTHRRMLRLATFSDTITLNGRIRGVDYVDVVEAPIWVYFSDQVLRKVGRYRIGLPHEWLA